MGEGEVSALLSRPAKGGWLLVLAHGSWGRDESSFMEMLAGELGSMGVATLRYQFPVHGNGGGFLMRPQC